MQRAVLKSRTLASTSGLPLVVDFAGPPDGPAIVFVHGGGQTRHAWRRALTAFAAQGYRAAAYDLRGHGDSGWAADGDYRPEAHSGDLMAVIGAMPNPPALVGASMGGQVAMCTVAAFGNAIARGLVLVDVTPQVDRQGRARILGFMQGNPEGFATVDEAAEAVARYQSHRPRAAATQGLARNLRAHADGRLRWHWDPRFLGSYEPDADAGEHRYSAAARQIRVPTLLVRGGGSELVNAGNVEHFRQLIPHAEYVDVQGATHMVVGDRNDAFNEAVLAFLAGLA